MTQLAESNNPVPSKHAVILQFWAIFGMLQAATIFPIPYLTELRTLLACAMLIPKLVRDVARLCGHVDFLPFGLNSSPQLLPLSLITG